jgi:phosphoadenosine phosphosulfate reductase
MTPLMTAQQDISAASARLEGKSAQEILTWAVDRYFPRLTMATAFGLEGCCILHMLAEIEPRVRVFNLDTGYQFAETLHMRDVIVQRYGIEVELVRPELDVAEFEASQSGPLYNREPDQCCYHRKLVPLRRALEGYEAWISGIRRDQSPFRQNAPVVGEDKKFGLHKVSPLVHWTRKDVWEFVTENEVPYNPLHDQGYASIGCWPCTRAVAEGDDERAGRWVGFGKTECGLHLDNTPGTSD